MAVEKSPPWTCYDENIISSRGASISTPSERIKIKRRVQSLLLIDLLFFTLFSSILQGRKIEATPLSMYNFFVERVKAQLHIVLCMSPIGDAFRNRLRMFPSLINCCTIDWFQVRNRPFYLDRLFFKKKKRTNIFSEMLFFNQLLVLMVA